MGKIYLRAINPEQYDLLDTNWGYKNSDSPFRRYLYHYLKKYKTSWKNANVLEIGCGSGWLLNLIQKEGAREVGGIEPSKNNFELIKKNFSGLRVHQIRLEDFKSKEKFDVIISVLVFNHIKDLSMVFKKINILLTKGGELHIIVPDYDYYRLSKFDYQIDIEEINEDEYAVQVNRRDGIIADVVRNIEVYKKKASKTGLVFVEDMKLYPTKELLEKVPKYRLFKKICREHLLKFKKL